VIRCHSCHTNSKPNNENVYFHKCLYLYISVCTYIYYIYVYIYSICKCIYRIIYLYIYIYIYICIFYICIHIYVSIVIRCHSCHTNSKPVYKCMWIYMCRFIDTNIYIWPAPVYQRNVQKENTDYGWPGLEGSQDNLKLKYSIMLKVGNNITVYIRA
jgi:hypothetical protein